MNIYDVEHQGKHQNTNTFLSPATSQRSYHSIQSPSSNRSTSPRLHSETDGALEAPPIDSLTPTTSPKIPFQNRTDSPNTTPNHGWKSCGKTIKINEPPLGDNGNESDIEMSSDEEDSNEELLKQLSNGPPVTEKELGDLIDIQIKSSDTGDECVITRDRLKLFFHLSKRIDTKKRDITKSFLTLFNNSMTDLRDLWEKRNVTVTALCNVPIWMKWMLVYICLCFGPQVQSEVISEALEKTIKKFNESKVSSFFIIKSLKSFVKRVEQNGTRQKKDNSQSNDDEGTPTYLPQTRDHTVLGSERSYELRPPPPPTETHLSRKTNFSLPSKKKRTIVDPPFSDNESDASSDRSSTCGKRSRRRTFSMDTLALQYPVGMRSPNDFQSRIRNMSENRRNVTFDDPPQSYIEPLRNVYSEVPQQQCREPPCNEEPPQDSEGNKFNQSKVHIGNGFTINSEYYSQKMMTHLRPNPYVASATKHVTSEMIKKGQLDPDYIIEIGDIMKSFVENISSTVVGKVTFDMQDYIDVIKLNDQKKSEAISFCLSFKSFLQHSGKDIVKIHWKDMTNWVKNFSSLLNAEIVRISTKRAKSSTTGDIKDEANNLRNNLEREIMKYHSDLLPMFEKLSSISDLCLYMLFGLNVLKTNSRIILTDMIVKSIISAWRYNGNFPRSLQDTGVDKMFLCLPIAHLLELHGFGAIELLEDKSEVPCSIDEFVDESAELA